MSEPRAVSQSEINEIFTQTVEELASNASAAAANALGSGLPREPVKLPVKDDGSLDLFADTSAIDEQFRKGIDNNDTRGVIGDMASLTLQLTTIGQRQRARNLRHLSRGRRAAHCYARLLTQGSNIGVWRQDAMRAVEDTDKRSKAQTS